MRTLLSALVMMSFAVLGPRPAHGGSLDPSKPSNLVTLVNFGQCSGSSVAGSRFDTRVMPDGSTVPFTIPAGMVFVVTGLDWQNSFVVPGGSDTVYAFANTPATGPGWFFAYGSGNGYGGSISLSGYAVASGAEICCGSNNGVIQGAPSMALHGFLAKDK